MNEADLPLPENADANTIADETSHSGQGTGLRIAPDGVAQLNSARISPALAGDILHGADAIAEFLYGDRKSRRKVYHLVDRGHIPFFKLGSNICTRKSVLLEWIGQQERCQVDSRSRSKE